MILMYFLNIWGKERKTEVRHQMPMGIFEHKKWYKQSSVLKDKFGDSMKRKLEHNIDKFEINLKYLKKIMCKIHLTYE